MYVTQDHQGELHDFIAVALREDLGDGDHSTRCCIDERARGKAVLKIKDHGVLAGLEVAEKVFRFVEPEARIRWFKQDGDLMEPGESAFEVEAHVWTILSCERVVLNCMQRMSGIATLTRTYTDRLKGYHTRLLDTRKTTPGFRLLEKEAVRIGGAVNHRFGLYDMIILKDNHIDFCGGIEKAIDKAYRYVQEVKPGLAIEVEARTLQDVATAVQTGKADRIMLDNFSIENIKEALKIIGRRTETEASGGITLENIQSYAATGVDFISSGAIIHQATSLDLSLKAVITQ